MEKSSAAKDPTDPPSQAENKPAATGLPDEEDGKIDELKPTGEFIAVVVKQACH